MAAEFCKVDSLLDSHPKILDAGFWGSILFQYLLRVNRSRRCDGAIPSRFVTARHVTIVTQMTNVTDDLKVDPVVIVERALADCERAELVTRREVEGVECVCINGWDDEWKGAKSDAERAREYRERKRDEASRDVTENRDCHESSRPKRRGEEKRREYNKPPLSPRRGVSSPSSGPSKSEVERAAAELLEAWNRYFAPQRRQPKAWLDHVRKALAAGFTAEQLRGASWGASQTCCDSPEVLANFTPATVLRLKSREGKRCLPQWLEQAEISWRESNGNESYPWLAQQELL